MAGPFYDYLSDQDGYYTIPVDNAPFQSLLDSSAVELLANRINMTTNTIKFSGSLSATDSIVPKAEFYPEYTGTSTSFHMDATKFGQAFPLTDEDLADEGSYINAVTSIGTQWASKHAVHLDNACLGVSGTSVAADTTVPFLSVYAAVTSSDSSYSYSANTNLATTTRALMAAISSSSTTGGYNVLSNFLALAEGFTDYNENDTVIIAHRNFKPLFRSVKNSNGDPMFFGGATTVSGSLQGTASRSSDVLFDIPIVWSNGARVSATASDSPSGHPLMILAQRSHLVLGVRSGPEQKEERIPGKDVVELMFRSRRAFKAADPNAFAVLELTA